MIAVILAGGLGTRLAEETASRPKPMVEIGGRPIIWHLMKQLHSRGITEFIICTGYKGYLISEFFLNYLAHTSDITIDFAEQRISYLTPNTENWKVTLVDTGASTNTGGRLKRIKHLLGNEEFLMTYGDGLSNIDIEDLHRTYKLNGTEAIVTAVQPQGRYGNLKIKESLVTEFHEKPLGDNTWVSGGFFILKPHLLDLVKSDEDAWENGPLRSLAQAGKLSAYKHTGFWYPVDTLRDKNFMEDLWESNQAPWKTW